LDIGNPNKNVDFFGENPKTVHSWDASSKNVED